MAGVGGLRYDGKVTIVTGGSKGIGEGCVREFVKGGSKVVFCAREEKTGKKLEEELNNNGPGEAFFIKCDVTDEKQILDLIEKTVEKYGQVDCLINNAGTHPPRQYIDDFSVEDFRDLLNLNLVSYFTASKYALPHLRKSKGNIINMSSLVQKLGQVGACTYVATKGAISAMTRALAVDEARYGVRVNTVSPGNIWTPLWKQEADCCKDPEAAVQEGKEMQLMGRIGTIEETGRFCLYLAAEGTFMTGTETFLSGGAELNYGTKDRTKGAEEMKLQ